MTDVSTELGIGNNNEAKKITDDLEARLNAQPTLNTDIIEFLAIAGVSYRDWEPFRYGSKRDPPYKDIYENLEKKRLVRTRTLTQGDRLVEGYIAKAIYYEYISENLKTVGDFKQEVEERGVRMPHLTYRGIAYMNKILEKYGFEQMTVPSGEKKELVKYGLKLTNRDNS